MQQLYPRGYPLRSPAARISGPTITEMSDAYFPDGFFVQANMQLMSAIFLDFILQTRDAGSLRPLLRASDAD